MRIFRITVAGALALSASSAIAATYQVGPTRPNTTLTQLFGSVDLGPGDIVEVDGDVDYPGDIVMPQADGGAAGNPVILRGIRVNGQRPRLVGGENTIEFRLSDHVVFESFEVIGSQAANTFRCVYHHAHDIVIRDAYIHDCPRHGILGADNDSGSLTIEYSEVSNAGSNLSHHAIYMATDEIAHPGAVFRLQFSYIHDSQYGSGEGGNLIKSRAERNEIYYNWLEGAYYHELELIGPDPDGGVPENQAREDSDVVGNVILHTADFGAVIRAGGDDTGQSYGRYRFVNNTIVRRNASDTPTIFRLFDGIESIEIHNNLIWREGANGARIIREVEADWSTGVSRVAGSGNWIDSNATFVPAAWTNTQTGTDPVVVNAATFDFRPAPGSPLINMGTNAPVTPSGFEIASPLYPPVWHPPQRALIAAGTAQMRTPNGVIDIGAFEVPDIGFLFGNGFE
jgi:hypothetical protein